MPSPPRPFPSAPRSNSPVPPAFLEPYDSGHALAGRPTPRLWRSRSNRVLAGVLGGLAEKFGWEPRPLRILYGLVTFATMGAALLPYVAMWAITRPHGPPRLTPRFQRSSTNAVFGGVLGGLAEKWDASPTLLRVSYFVLTGVTGVFPGVLAYLVTWTATRAADAPRNWNR